MLELVPITLKEANAFVERYHRHHKPVVGHKFSIAASDGEKIVGVAIVGMQRREKPQEREYLPLWK